MSAYNIIYTAPGHTRYLWNGSSFDKLAEGGQDVLHYSGKTFHSDEVKGEMEECREAAKKMFPQDDVPEIRPVEIKVS